MAALSVWLGKASLYRRSGALKLTAAFCSRFLRCCVVRNARTIRQSAASGVWEDQGLGSPNGIRRCWALPLLKRCSRRRLHKIQWCCRAQCMATLLDLPAFCRAPYAINVRHQNTHKHAQTHKRTRIYICYSFPTADIMKVFLS